MDLKKLFSEIAAKNAITSSAKRHEICLSGRSGCTSAAVPLSPRCGPRGGKKKKKNNFVLSLHPATAAGFTAQ